MQVREIEWGEVISIFSVLFNSRDHKLKDRSATVTAGKPRRRCKEVPDIYGGDMRTKLHAGLGVSATSLPVPGMGTSLTCILRFTHLHLIHA